MGRIYWNSAIHHSVYLIQEFYRDDTEATIGDKLNSFDETLVHAASETAFVTFWVVMAYLIFEFGMIISGISEADLSDHGSGIGAVCIRR